MAEVNFHFQAKNNGTPISLLEVFKDAFAEVRFWKKHLKFGYIEIKNVAGERRHYIANKFWELILREADEKNGVFDIRNRQDQQTSLYSRLQDTYFLKLVLGIDDWFVYQYFPLRRCLIIMLERHFKIFHNTSEENKQLHKMLILALKNSPPKIHTAIKMPIFREVLNIDPVHSEQDVNNHPTNASLVLIEDNPTIDRPEFGQGFQMLNPLDHSSPEQNINEINVNNNPSEMGSNTHINSSYPETTPYAFPVTCSAPGLEYIQTPHMPNPYAPCYPVPPENLIYLPAGVYPSTPTYLCTSPPPPTTFLPGPHISSGQDIPYMPIHQPSLIPEPTTIVPYDTTAPFTLYDSGHNVLIPPLPAFVLNQRQNIRADFLYTAEHHAVYLQERDTNSNEHYLPQN